MPIPTWATSADFQTAMGDNAWREIYDEDLDGVPDAAKIAMDLQRAHAQVAARVRQAHSGSLPESDEDGFLKMAVLEYAQGFANDRHPEYRKFKGEFMARGKALCEDVRSGKALPAPATTEPVPSMGSATAAADADSALPTFARDRSSTGCCS